MSNSTPTQAPTQAPEPGLYGQRAIQRAENIDPKRIAALRESGELNALVAKIEPEIVESRLGMISVGVPPEEATEEALLMFRL